MPMSYNELKYQSYLFQLPWLYKKYLISGSPWGVPRTAWHLSGLSDELMWPQSLPPNKSGPVNLTSLNYGFHWRYGGFLKCGYPTGFPTKNDRNTHIILTWSIGPRSSFHSRQTSSSSIAPLILGAAKDMVRDPKSKTSTGWWIGGWVSL